MDIPVSIDVYKWVLMLNYELRMMNYELWITNDELYPSDPSATGTRKIDFVESSISCACLLQTGYWVAGYSVNSVQNFVNFVVKKEI